MPVSPNKVDSFPVVVIGAGMAGLTAAIHLAERGIEPLVLEADSQWAGGRLSGGAPTTFEYQGRVWLFDSEHGVHALWGGYDNMRTMLRHFIHLELRESVGEVWINRWGREVRAIEAGRSIRWSWVPAPFHYLQLLLNPRFWNTINLLDFLSFPGFLFSLLWTVGFDPIGEGVALDGLTMKEYFRGWTPNLRATFTGLGVNLLAAPAEDISLTAFIAAIRFYTMLRRDSWQPEYFPGSTHQTVIQPLIDRIEGMGGKVMCGAAVQSLQRTDDGWRVQVEDARLGRRSLMAQQVILAVDAPAAQRLLCASPDTAEAAARIRFPGTVRNVTVRLWYDCAPEDGSPSGMFTGDFLPDNFFWLHRLYDDFHEWHEVTGGSVIEVHLYARDNVLEQPDKVLLIRVVDEVQRAFPELRGHFVHGDLRRNSRVHTTFRVPTTDSLHVETSWPGILACGDWIGCESPSLNMERACVTGMAAANAVLAANGLEPYRIIPPREPEGFARVLGGLVRAFRRTMGRALVAGVRGVRKMRSGGVVL